MQQLNALDASFLYVENEKSPLNVAGFMICDPSTTPGGYSYGKLMTVLRERVYRLPRLQQRLLETPFNLDRPYWMYDRKFDFYSHVRLVKLPAPGDWAELCSVMEQAIVEPLDRKRPLWEMRIIEGLDNVEGYPRGSIAFLFKAHHAALDGGSAMEVMSTLLDPCPQPRRMKIPDPPEEDWIPGPKELFLRALEKKLEAPAKIKRLLKQALESEIRAASVETLEGGERHPAVFSAPRTRFNEPVSAERVFDSAAFSLPEVKAAAKAHGATVNDVVLAVCAGALRRYLLEKGELPEEPLTTQAPVSVRRENEKGAMGNQVSQLVLSLHTDVKDPAERLRAIRDGARRAKARLEAYGSRELMEMTELLSPVWMPLFMGAYHKLELCRVHRPLFNTVITNVRGPGFPLYVAGAKVLAPFAAVQSFDGLGLAFVVLSHLDKLTISVNACARMLPDKERLARYLRESFEELKGLKAGAGKSLPIAEQGSASRNENLQSGQIL